MKAVESCGVAAVVYLLQHSPLSLSLFFQRVKASVSHSHSSTSLLQPLPTYTCPFPHISPSSSSTTHHGLVTQALPHSFPPCRNLHQWSSRRRHGLWNCVLRPMQRRPDISLRLSHLWNQGGIVLPGQRRAVHDVGGRDHKLAGQLRYQDLGHPQLGQLLHSGLQQRPGLRRLRRRLRPGQPPQPHVQHVQYRNVFRRSPPSSASSAHVLLLQLHQPHPHSDPRCSGQAPSHAAAAPPAPNPILGSLRLPPSEVGDAGIQMLLEGGEPGHEGGGGVRADRGAEVRDGHDVGAGVVGERGGVQDVAERGDDCSAQLLQQHPVPLPAAWGGGRCELGSHGLHAPGPPLCYGLHQGQLRRRQQCYLQIHSLLQVIFLFLFVFSDADAIHIIT